jgi:glycosyltransferase involved in cell wall biosynthesis
MNDINKLIENREKNIRSKYNISSDAKVIVFTGRLLEEKGIIPLVSSVERICKDREDVYLFLVGDGPLEEYVNII